MTDERKVVLEVQGLRKSFGTVKAVDGIGFKVLGGEVFTIIGTNGAGKTTTLEMIEGLQMPDEGDITILGLKWDRSRSAIKMRIGVQPQTSALFDLLTVEENLETFASFYDRQQKIDDILSYINLTDHRNKRVKVLSGGQKQRLAIGLAMINDPDLIFLDEPTTGLDPQARRNIWDIVLKLRAQGKTTILTTHYMEEADKLSDRVCIVDQGRVVALDTPKALIGQLTREREIHLTFTDGDDPAAEAEAVTLHHAAVTRVKRDGDHLIVWSVKPEETLYKLFAFTSEHGIQVEQVSIREMSLEDVFIAFTGKEWRD
ncbi:Linearmycin resistance ATP-binding protein LnrL [Paenibacillus plantiphilus]|uniref:Linearmycin resistance ATP-binding protein LnrL n=1 Tax=Paenibacillus plantiphilus TaxID=2905650 RepID=A0ABN8H7L0_9BACL|nr:ABC transporter ATP-binding protein [Paenibacillus plantiphilus]CAH1226303.1 Linearmycin resistance ATP-binding protein LnrL [Paenibacillus plantiphilus]